jgi:hypothetical protein
LRLEKHDIQGRSKHPGIIRDFVGCFVGFDVGCSVGRLVGPSVGDWDGKLVGSHLKDACTKLMVRTISTPRPKHVFIVTYVIKKDDIRGKELPNISKAASGFSIIIAIVSKIEPAIVVTKKTFTTWNKK